MVNKAAAWKMYLDRGNDEPFWLNGVLVIPSKWGSSVDDNGLKSPQVKFLCSNPNCNGRLFGLYSARHYCKKEDNGVPTGSADDPPPPLPPPPPPAQKKTKSSKSSSDKSNSGTSCQVRRKWYVQRTTTRRVATYPLFINTPVLNSGTVLTTTVR